MIDRDLRRISRLSLLALAVRRRWGWLLGAVFFGLVGSLFVAVPWGMLARDARIDAEGARGRGEIQILTTESDGDGGTDYVIQYTVVLPRGGAVRGRGEARRDDWKTLRVGDEIAVHYDPAAPDINFPADARYSLGRVRTPGFAVLMSACGLPFVILGGLVAWGLLIRLPGAWHRLLTYGMTTDGHVVAVERHRDSDGDATGEWTLRYIFRDRFGTEQEGKTEPGPEALFADWAEGDAGLVQVDRRDAATSVWLGRGDLAFYR